MFSQFLQYEGGSGGTSDLLIVTIYICKLANYKNTISGA